MIYEKVNTYTLKSLSKRQNLQSKHSRIPLELNLRRGGKEETYKPKIKLVPNLNHVTGTIRRLYVEVKLVLFYSGLTIDRVIPLGQLVVPPHTLLLFSG